MAALKGNKAKGRRSSRHKGLYQQQRLRTARNKMNRAAARARRKAKGLAKKAKRAESSAASPGLPHNPHRVNRTTRKIVSRVHDLCTASLNVIAARCWA